MHHSDFYDSQTGKVARVSRRGACVRVDRAEDGASFGCKEAGRSWNAPCALALRDSGVLREDEDGMFRVGMRRGSDAS